MILKQEIMKIHQWFVTVEAKYVVIIDKENIFYSKKTKLFKLTSKKEKKER